MKNLCFAKKDFINSKVFLEEKNLEKKQQKKEKHRQIRFSYTGIYLIVETGWSQQHEAERSINSWHLIFFLQMNYAILTAKEDITLSLKT